LEHDLAEIPAVQVPVMAEQAGYEKRQTLEYERGSFLTQANKLAPQNPPILLGLAEARFRSHQFDQTLSPIEELIAVLKAGLHDETDLSGYLQLSEQILTGLRQVAEYSNPAAYDLAQVLYLEGKPRQTLALLKLLGPASRDDSSYYNLLGMTYAALDQLQDAASQLERAIALAPRSLDYYFNLAAVYQKAGDSHQAAKILNQIVAQGGQSPEVYFSLGLSYFNLGRYSDAMSSFQEALKLRSDFGEAEFFVARCEEKLSRFPQAEAAYGETSRIEPSFSPAYYRLALLMLRTERTEEAIPLLQSAIRLTPNDANAHYQLGKLYSERHQLPAAVNELEKAVSADPNFDAPYHKLAQLYAQMGNTSKAREYFVLISTRKAERLKAYQLKVSGTK